MFSLRAILARVVSRPSTRLTAILLRSSPRIVQGVLLQIEKLLSDDAKGITYRSFVAFWDRSDHPPLERYLGVSSVCTIHGPLREAHEGHPYHCLVPAGGLIESPGVTLALTPDEADDIRICLIDTIEETILHWLASRKDVENDGEHLPSGVQSEVPNNG